MRHWLPAAVFLTCTGAALPVLAQPLEVESLRSNGPASHRIDLAVLGDGYRVEDQAKLTADATSLIEYLFSVPPFAQYADLFNVKLVHVISNQNGADGGDYGASRDTALGAYYFCSDIERLICIDTGQVLSVAATNVPEFDLAFVIVNDTKYGGSGGIVATTSVHPSAFEILTHELGHSLGNLADEYEDPYPGYPACGSISDCPEPNATLRNVREQIKWRSWIAESTPVPTPETGLYAESIGVFEGARYLTSNIYRPHQNCKMRVGGVDFCSVCREALVRSYWERIELIEAVSPDGNVSVNDCEPFEVTVTTPPLEESTYRFTWTLDGSPLAELTDTIELDPSTLEVGAHTLSVLVEDETELVRNDPEMLLRGEHVWSITVTEDCSMSGTGGTSGTGGSGGTSGSGGTGG